MNRADRRAAKRAAKHKPQRNAVNYDATMLAIKGVALLSELDVIARSDRIHTVIDLACQCKATHDDWRDLFNAVNITDQLMRMRLVAGREHLENLQTMIESIMIRQKSTGQQALYAAEIAELRQFAHDHEAVLTGLSCKQLYDAEVAVARRLLQARNTNYAPEHGVKGLTL